LRYEAGVVRARARDEFVVRRWKRLCALMVIGRYDAYAGRLCEPHQRHRLGASSVVLVR